MGIIIRELLPPDFRAYRSPWFDSKCRERNNDPVAIGQELQIEYLSSGSPRFALSALAQIAATVRQPIERLTVEFSANAIHIVPGEPGELWIYERPEPAANYVVAIDPSSGNANRSERGSRVVTSQTGVLVLNTTAWPDHCTVAAYFQSRQLDPGWTALLASRLGAQYNNAMMIFEVTGLGQALLVTLIGSGRESPLYSRFYRQRRSKPDEKGNSYRLGWWNNSSTRPLLEKAVSDSLYRLTLNDSRVLDQLKTFVWAWVGQELQGRAQEGCNDDAVISLGLALLGGEQCHGPRTRDEQGRPEWADELDAYRRGTLGREALISRFMTPDAGGEAKDATGLANRV